MSILTRSQKSISARQGQRNLHQQGVRAAEVHTQALALLADFPLTRPPQARFDEQSVLSVLLYAAAPATSLEHAGRALPDAPPPNTVRNAVQHLTVPQVETHLNDAWMTRPLRRLLKSPRQVAIDLRLVSYYGQPQPGEEDFVWHLQAQRGIARFFVYATVYVIKKGRRFTLALRACRHREGRGGGAGGTGATKRGGAAPLHPPQPRARERGGNGGGGGEVSERAVEEARTEALCLWGASLPVCDERVV